MTEHPPLITVVGGGLAGAESAWAAASRGAQVLLYEMRPGRMTPAHRTDLLAELVCSNSFKSALLSNASGLLKEEMRRLGSLLLRAAQAASVPAGEALAVDPVAFAQEVTERVHSHPEITVVREEVTEVPDESITIIATGPLTSDSLARSLQEIAGAAALSFYDAVAPTVTYDSLDHSKVYRASRRGRALHAAAEEPVEPGDYLNCPMTAEEYARFYEALVEAEQAIPHLPEESTTPFFEGCMPIEELARRGPRTLLFGPLRPVGLVDPRTGKRPFAVVQLRQENRAGTLWGLVGFQTRLKWPDQKKVFRLIPGLENAEFVRYGVMHRNTYLNSPTVLHPTLQLRSRPAVFVAGQLTGVEGYMESAATGILAGINAVRMTTGRPPVVPPAETVLGSLVRYITEADPAHFAPMNANHGLLPPLDRRIRNRQERGMAYAERSLAMLEEWKRREDVRVPEVP